MKLNLKAAMDADETGEGFIYEAMLYELENHEYCITMDAEDAFRTLRLSYEDVLQDDRLRRGFQKAHNEIFSEE